MLLCILVFHSLIRLIVMNAYIALIEATDEDDMEYENGSE